jgi:glucose-1-phosphate thymidylyltransferase
MSTKGIILAGGSGTRLYPLTKSTSKQLLPVYDKPMIYYPLAILMQSNIKEILIITTKSDKNNFVHLLGNGSKLGINIYYEIQNKPNGLPEAFIIGEDFIGNDRVCLILGDNIFYSDGFVNNHIIPNLNKDKSVIFGYHVKSPERYGIVEFDDDLNILSIVEKPTLPRSNYAITGLYIFDSDVSMIAKSLKISKRGEKEIVDVIKHYLTIDKLKLEILGRGTAWLDTGTHESLLQAANFVEVIESRQGLKIACIEEIAYKQGFISRQKLNTLAKPLKNSGYGEYLLNVKK